MVAKSGTLSSLITQQVFFNREMYRLLLLFKSPPPHFPLAHESWPPRGVTLEELAALMVDQGGAWFAINMDGGGSSTLVDGRDGLSPRVINRPTCLDLPFPSCQRKVATVHCLYSID
jgi:hypothetical protein